MQDFKEKLYNYEAKPPADAWNNIASKLDGPEHKVVPMQRLRKRSKLLFYAVTAAASLVIIFISSLLFNKAGDSKNANSTAINQSLSNTLSPEKIQDSIELNNRILKEIIRTSKDKNLLAQNFESSLIKSKKYLTIAGPEGQPVKISPKVATLIESADNEFPPKPVLNKKIEKWKQIMLSSTLPPTSTNLLDIVELSSPNENNE